MNGFWGIIIFKYFCNVFCNKLRFIVDFKNVDFVMVEVKRDNVCYVIFFYCVIWWMWLWIWVVFVGRVGWNVVLWWVLLNVLMLLWWSVFIFLSKLWKWFICLWYCCIRLCGLNGRLLFVRMWFILVIGLVRGCLYIFVFIVLKVLRNLIF